jgi:hypothetical protein
MSLTLLVKEDSQKKARTDQDALVEGVELRQSGKSLEDAATEAKCDVRQLRDAVSRLQAQHMGPGGQSTSQQILVANSNGALSQTPMPPVPQRRHVVWWPAVCPPTRLPRSPG